MLGSVRGGRPARHAEVGVPVVLDEREVDTRQVGRHRERREDVGHLELSELRATLQRLDPTFTDDDVAQVFGFFPRDEGGRVTERDFVRGLETMKAFS